MSNIDNLIEFSHIEPVAAKDTNKSVWGKIITGSKNAFIFTIKLYPVLIALFIAALIPFLMPKINNKLLTQKPETEASAELLDKAEKKLNNDIGKLNKYLAAKIPKGNYLIINSSSNDFSLYKGDKLIKSDKCSTGSYVLLKNGENQQWMFKTPKGEFHIHGKTTSPIWRKPDWAFVEDGLPVPSAYHYSRYEAGVLGDYALSLGQGYLIHGTLYQRFLGLPVTHGCIRLNDASLELIYKSLDTGSKVYIY